jgi:hypothetical protein
VSISLRRFASLSGSSSCWNSAVTHAAPRYAHPFVAAFLLAIVVCALAPLNLWPFSNWALFSRLRSAQETSWEAIAVSGSGREHGYPIGAIPVRDRSRDCAKWLNAGQKPFGTGTRVVLIYRFERLLSDREGSRAESPRRTLAWSCSSRGTRAS